MSAPAVITGLLDFRRLDLLATGDSALHRLDARAKLLVTLVFIICTMSFHRYAVASLIPYIVFPVAVAMAARLPLAFLLRKVVLVLPLALLIALPNPWFDREVLVQLGGLQISGGWISLLSIVLRSLLAAAAAIVLVAVTGFPAICGAMERMGMPRALVVQLLLLYRYLAVLGEESARMIVAREQRSDGRPLSIRLYGTLVGRLLLRTWNRAERIYLAMRARGFTGDFRSGQPSRLDGADFAYVAGWCGLFLLLRVVDVTQWLGTAALGVLR